MKVEKTDKGVMQFAPIIGVAVLAVASVPLLPLLFAANPDQCVHTAPFYISFLFPFAFPPEPAQNGGVFPSLIRTTHAARHRSCASSLTLFVSCALRLPLHRA